MSALLSGPSSIVTKRSTSRGTPACQRASTMTAAHLRVCGAALMMTPLPTASAASTDPAGIATGKFHGGVTTVRLSGTNSAPSTASRRRADSA